MVHEVPTTLPNSIAFDLNRPEEDSMKKIRRIKAGEIYDETWSSQIWAGIRPLFDALKIPLELCVTFDHNVLDQVAEGGDR